MQKGDNVLNKNFAFFDKDYLDMFTYPLKYGTAKSLNQKGNVILLEKTAALYFNEENPVGKMIKLRKDGQEDKSFMVGGILKYIPENTSVMTN